MRQAKAAMIAALCLLSGPALGISISEAKMIPDGVQVALSGCVTLVEPSELYIEEPERSAGIWVAASTGGVQLGDAVDVTGTMWTVNGERVVWYGNAYPRGAGPLILPLGMPTRAVGGGWFGLQDCAADCRLYKPPVGDPYYAWYPAQGLNNTGLLVRTWGKVLTTYATADAKWFYIDDGYGATADLAERGILVYSERPVNVSDYVVVTGISGVEGGIDDGSRLIRVIRTRFDEDVEVVAQEQICRPFSDEFNSLHPDPRWAIDVRYGHFSTAANSGWLRITLPEDGGNPYQQQPYPVYGVQFVQASAGDWDLFTRVRVECSESTAASQALGLQVRPVGMYGIYGTQLPAPVDLWQMGRVPFMGQFLYVAGREVIPYSGETVSFNVHKEGLYAYVSYSLDGYSFSKPYRVEVAGMDYVSLVARSYNEGGPPGRPFIGYVDCMRFSTECGSMEAAL